MKKFLTSKIGNILLCIAEIIVGVLLLVNPDAVTSAFIIGAGAVMILTGIVFCTLYFVGEAEKMVIKQLLFKGLLAHHPRRSVRDAVRRAAGGAAVRNVGVRHRHADSGGV